MRKFLRKLRFVFGALLEALLLFIILFSLFNAELVCYGIAQARGQLHIVWNARPITEVLAEKNVPDSVKEKLRLVESVRAFAFDSLGLNRNENYTDYYDQQGQRLMWVVTGCEPYALKPHLWHFPVLGDVPYKGFFEEAKAKTEAENLRKQGLDVSIGGASGWSTLGWFNDPVLSSMLQYEEGDLAELLIHELTHGTLFVKDSVDFNENLASFIGEKGALLYLHRRYPNDSSALHVYLDGNADQRCIETFMLRSARRLDSLYKEIGSAPAAEKFSSKKMLMHRIVVEAQALPLHDSAFAARLEKRIALSGNAVFMNYVRYGAKKNSLEEMFQKSAGGDIKKFLALMRKRYGS